MNKRNNLILLTALALVPLALQLSACGEKFDSCENTITCVDGDGDPTGGAGGGDGDNTGGTGGGAGGSIDTCSPACSGDTSVCDEDTKECVACLKDSDCDSDAPYCDTGSNECVACLETPQCTDAAASVCTDGECGMCSEDDDCKHIEGKNLCDAGSCVECTSEADCDGKVCDPDTKSCTDVDAGMTPVCVECEYDAQCMTGQLCVEQSFGAPKVVVGNFCTWRLEAIADDGEEFCYPSARPFVDDGSAVTSVNGEVAHVCFLDSTTCGGYLDYKQPDICTVADDVPTGDQACGLEGVQDGLCRIKGATPLCTYPCSAAEECPGSNTCIGAPTGYCSL